MSRLKFLIFPSSLDICDKHSKTKFIMNISKNISRLFIVTLILFSGFFSAHSMDREDPIIIMDGSLTREDPIIIMDGSLTREDPIIIMDGSLTREDPIIIMD